ncbi:MULTISPECIES: sialidase family protein [unclassified Plantactinospora]|uniref:sialidase family protein n=1 Tax=unclassified Plantactinospora TaxID=2631981 RepID=UPI000D15D0A2|nr:MULTISPECIES: sialidase family protein [unclassified Plantactinospora]AVT31272.1 hypothetical protein C6361_19310 [Plantactinospora sp. BC1]AVT39819.1 hypothetical protein C6W10_28995 [Plantactinospora sp. BB1]
MPEPDFAGLGQAAQAAFRPHFAEVERRSRRRRRRTRAAGVAGLVAVVAVGAGLVWRGLPSDDGAADRIGTLAPPGRLDRTPDFVPTPDPSASARGGTPAPSTVTGRMLAGDLRHLYLRYRDCQGDNCAIRLAASVDGGATWESYPLPVPDNSGVHLRVVAPRTLVAEVETRPRDAEGRIDIRRSEEFWLASNDGGVNWRRTELTEVAAVPETFRPLAWVPNLDGLTVLAADPTTGDVVRLARKVPLHSARVIEDMPAGAGLWVTGWTDRRVGSVREPNGTVSENKVIYSGSAIRVSRDGGRTWRQSVLPEDILAGGNFGAAALAIGDRVAYAVGQLDGELRVYRSEDQGRNWRRTAARAEVGDRMIQAGLRPDGTLLIQVGILAGENPVMFEGLDRGERLREVPVGPGASAVALPDGYAQPGNQDSSGGWLSEDGVRWRYVGPPTIRR